MQKPKEDYIIHVTGSSKSSHLALKKTIAKTHQWEHGGDSGCMKMFYLKSLE